MSTHEVLVVKIDSIISHPNADLLDIVQIWDYSCVVKKGEFQVGDLAVYLEPDYVVPDTEQFSFLNGHNRIKCRKIRGIWSQGLLIPAPQGTKEGDNVIELLGITRYDPDINNPKLKGGQAGQGPAGFFPKYDLEPYKKYRRLLEGKVVFVSEKLHGTSARFCCREDKMFCGSRDEWKKEDYSVLWWKQMKGDPWIEEWCREYQDLALYGEIFGQVQNLKYDAPSGITYFKAFDVLEGDKWLDYPEFEKLIPEEYRVPTLYVGSYSQDLEKLAIGKSSIASHIREGCVFKTIPETTEWHVGRVALKLINDEYLSKDK